MYEIEPATLYVGHALDVRNPRLLFEQEIVAVVDVAYEEPPAALPREIIYCRIPLLDGGGNDAARLRLAVDTLIRLLGAGLRTLVGCSAGMNRSPCVAAAALACHLRQSPERVLERLGRLLPLEVSPQLWAEISQIAGDIRHGN